MFFKKKKQILELNSEIHRLRAERDNAINHQKEWEKIFSDIICDLQKKYNVNVKIEFPEAPLIDACTLENDHPVYIRGMSNGYPTISFDFTNHDKDVSNRNRGNS